VIEKHIMIEKQTAIEKHTPNDVTPETSSSNRPFRDHVLVRSTGPEGSGEGRSAPSTARSDDYTGTPDHGDRWRPIEEAGVRGAATGRWVACSGTGTANGAVGRVGRGA
jgi:hypothetical protein